MEVRVRYTSKRHPFLENARRDLEGKPQPRRIWTGWWEDDGHWEDVELMRRTFTTTTRITKKGLQKCLSTSTPGQLP